MRVPTVLTVNSSGPVAEMYPESLGQYNIIRGVFRNDHPVYKHVDRDDRFIVYYGNIYKMYFINDFVINIYLPLDYWYITEVMHEFEEGFIRSVPGGTLLSTQGWEYLQTSCQAER